MTIEIKRWGGGGGRGRGERGEGKGEEERKRNTIIIILCGSMQLSCQKTHNFSCVQCAYDMPCNFC